MGEKKSTGLPFLWRVAAIATSEASVFTTNGTLSSMANKTALAIILFKSSNAISASEDKGNDLQLVMGLILSEKLGTHQE